MVDAFMVFVFIGSGCEPLPGRFGFALRLGHPLLSARRGLQAMLLHQVDHLLQHDLRAANNSFVGIQERPNVFGAFAHLNDFRPTGSVALEETYFHAERDE